MTSIKIYESEKGQIFIFLLILFSNKPSRPTFELHKASDNSVNNNDVNYYLMLKSDDFQRRRAAGFSFIKTHRGQICNSKPQEEETEVVVGHSLESKIETIK